MATVSQTSSSTPAGRGGRGGRTPPLTFYRQVVAEMRKVVWPTQHQVVTYFVVVLVFVVVMMAIIAGLDYGFSKAVFEVLA